MGGREAQEPGYYLGGCSGRWFAGGTAAASGCWAACWPVLTSTGWTPAGATMPPPAGCAAGGAAPAAAAAFLSPVK